MVLVGSGRLTLDSAMRLAASVLLFATDFGSAEQIAKSREDMRSGIASFREQGARARRMN